MGTKPSRTFHYSVAQDRAARVSVDGNPEVELGAEWKPEHLVLAGLVRCTLQSLRFHAEPLEIDFVANGSASGLVTRRPDDGRYAFVELAVKLELEVDPAPPGEELAALLAKAERDCFVGASLQPSPSYSWHVNGTAL